MTLLAETDPGYADLCQLVSVARLGSPKGQAQASWGRPLVRYYRGLIALSGCRQGPIAQHLLAGDEAQALRARPETASAVRPGALFRSRCKQQLRPGDQRLIQGLLRLASRCEAPVVATNNVHYAEEAGYRLHDTAPPGHRCHATLDASYAQRHGNSEAHCKGAAEMARSSSPTGPDALRRRSRSPSAARSPARRAGSAPLPHGHRPATGISYRVMSKCREQTLWRRAGGRGR